MDANMQDEPTLPWPAEYRGQTAPLPQVQGVIPPASVVAPPKKKLSRRKLFGVAALGTGAVAAVTAGGIALEQVLQHGGLNSVLHGPLESNLQLGHLLRKAGFGASAQDLAIYKNLSFQDAVNRLLNYQQVDDSAMEKRLNALNLNLGNGAVGSGGVRGSVADMQRWWLLRMAWTQRPLLEKMTLFWSGVLTSSFRKAGGIYAVPRMVMQNQFLRAHAFDTFDNILLGITADPAMLFYLDLTKSRKNSPNENYARELMELFTIGVGNYTQQDVFGGAAALTGWHINGPTSSRYYPGDHNTLEKTFLGQRGNFDYKDVIRMLTNHPAAPWFICRKLFTFFVYENPSNDDVSPLVDTYVKSGHNMGEVMKTLLLSPQFLSSKAYRSRIKSPVEFAVGAYRVLDIQGDGQGLQTITTLMGQPLFDPPNVAGWPGDKVSAQWINSGTWMARLNYIDQLLINRNPNGHIKPVDLQSIIDANKINSPESFVNYFSTLLHDGNMPADRLSQFVSYFTANTGSRANLQITLANGKSYPLNNVRGTLYLMMAAPEYHVN
jgi:uncharacterized protein (DUF1800 family)